MCVYIYIYDVFYANYSIKKNLDQLESRGERNTDFNDVSARCNNVPPGALNTPSPSHPSKIHFCVKPVEKIFIKFHVIAMSRGNRPFIFLFFFAHK